MRSLKIFSIVCLTGLFVSCSDWLDVNTDPNNPSSASPELVFSAGTVEVGGMVGGYYNLLGGFWSQYWTQSNSANQYKYIDQYQVTSTEFNNQWRDMYAGGLNDLQYTIDNAEANENWSLYLMGTVVQCYGFQVLADLYDQIPYFDALKGEAGNTKAKYDSGEDVYDDLIVRLDNALAKTMTSLSTSEITSDLVFGGDIDEWIKFANTLKLKIYMRQMYGRPDVAEAGVKALYASGASFLTEDAKLNIFKDEEGYDNPLYASDRRALNVATNLRASSTLFRYLQNMSDPRFANIFDKAPDKSTGISLPQGGFNIPTAQADPNKIAIMLIKPEDPVFFISAAESYFLQAEAVAKGWVAGDAKALYDSGVTSAFARFGHNASTFLAGAYAFPTTGTFEQKQEAIIVQKWISMAVSQGIEAFFETNRTGYPSISTIPATDTEYPGGMLTYSLEGVTSGKWPKRLMFPKLERDSNPNTPAAVAITEPVWWDKK